MEQSNQDISAFIKQNSKRIQDFPKPGVTFMDIQPLISNPDIFIKITEAFASSLKDIEFDKLVILEARGFIFGSALGIHMKKGVVLVRKKGKLPGKVEQYSYDLEYGKDTFEMQSDAISKGQKVVIIDDMLASGGTALAATQLVEKAGGVVAALIFLYQLKDLKGDEKLSKYKIINLHVE